MRKIGQEKAERFGKLMRAMLLRRFGVDLDDTKPYVKVPTKYGPLEIRCWWADYMYNFFTCFDDPSKLPGEQVPYHFRRPETHQTYSKGGHIGGWSFNGYSGKWNFHLSNVDNPMDAVQMIDDAIGLVI